MSVLKNKLNNKHGATIILALLLLLVALTVGILLLTSSVTTLEQVNSQKDKQQAYLSVSSAAQMIIDDLSISSYSGNIDKVYSIEDKDMTSPISELSTEDVDFAKGMFGELINKGIKYMKEHNFDATEPTAFEISVNDLPELDPVKGEFTIKKGKGNGEYVITVELEDTDKYKCTLTVNGVYSEDKELTFDMVTSGTNIVSEDGYYEVEPGTGSYEYKETVKFIGNGQGNRSPKSFVPSEDGEFLVTYRYVGEGKGDSNPENITFASDHKGELQAIYEGVSDNSGDYTYKLPMDETNDGSGEYIGEFTPYDEGMGDYNAIDWEYTSNTDGDSQGIYVYNSSNILEDNHYEVIEKSISKGKEYNAVYAHVDNNSGQYDVDLNKGFASWGGDFKQVNYYYIDGYTGILSGLDHYSEIVNEQLFYKNQYNGIDCYEKYIKKDSASSGDYIRVSESQYENAIVNLEPVDKNTVYLTKYQLTDDPSDYYEKLSGTMITNMNPNNYSEFRRETIYYTIPGSDIVYSDSLYNLVDIEWSWTLVFYISDVEFKNPTYSYATEKTTDWEKPKYPDSNNYYYYNEDEQIFVKIDGSTLEKNRDIYKKENVYVECKNPGGTYSNPIQKDINGKRYTIKTNNAIYEFTVENLGTFYYIDVGSNNGEYDSSFGKTGNLNYIRISESKYTSVSKKEAYEYVGDGLQAYCPIAYVEKTNGSYKIDYFVYSENNTGEFHVEFRKSNNGLYGLKEIKYVKDGGDHKATDFEYAGVFDGNYGLTGYKYVGTGGNFKVINYQPTTKGEGDFIVVGYTGPAEPDTGDHRVGNFINVGSGNGSFLQVYDLATGGKKGNYSVSEWKVVENGDYISEGGSYVPKAGGNYEKVDSEAVKYKVKRTPVRLTWNNVDIKKGGSEDE